MSENTVPKEAIPKNMWGGKGVYLAMFFAITNFVSGLKYRQDGDLSRSDDSFIGAVMILLGVAMYSLAKRRKAGVGFIGSRIVETMIFLIVLFVFLMGLVNTGWQNSPLAWTVIPVWSMVAYLMTAFSKPKNSATR